MTKNDKLNNDNKDITDVVPQNEIDTPIDKNKQFIEAYLDCLDVREAGRRLGYAESTINSGYLYQKFNKPEFQEKLKSAYIARDYQDLALIYSLERKGLIETAQQAKDKPESIITNLSKLKHITKQKKQTTGVLMYDRELDKPSYTSVMINARQLMVALNSGSTQTQQTVADQLGLSGNPEVIDAEALDED